jgi:beta-ureidopropionase / N-carbamoyl-L-amino-acid hydrolase
VAAAACVPDLALAERVFQALAVLTSDGNAVTRASYGAGENAAHALVRQEAERLGLAIRTDAALNLYMTLPGQRPGPAICIGSHLDSVPRGGNFDGAAGVLAGLCVQAGFVSQGLRPLHDITVVAIRAEESTWFGASYIGSRAAFGRLTEEELDQVVRAGDGVALGAAIAAAGGDPDRLRRGEPFLDATRIACFIEPHIEQGPVLVERAIPIAVVTGIRGSFRYRQARCCGSYAHSGATPRAGRRDAVRATSSLVVAMHRLWDALEAEGLDATITFGQFSTDPAEHAFSKVAGEVRFSLDVRSQEKATLDRVHDALLTITAGIEQRQGVRFELGPRTGSKPALMHPTLVSALLAAGRADGLDVPALPCGAGHDAAVFAEEGVPTAMIFIRNEHGSHNPDERMEMADFAAAARLLAWFCANPPAVPGG